jgi:hypothetical protein
LNVNSSIPQAHIVAIHTHFIGNTIFSIKHVNINPITAIIRAEGELNFSASLSLKNNAAIRIANIPAAEIAVSDR